VIGTISLDSVSQLNAVNVSSSETNNK